MTLRKDKTCQIVGVAATERESVSVQENEIHAELLKRTTTPTVYEPIVFLN